MGGNVGLPARRRRRRRLGLALVIVGAIGAATAAASMALFHPTDVLVHERQRRLDRVYAIQGETGIVARFSAATPHERRELQAWIGDRGQTTLVHLLVEDVKNQEEWTRASAIMVLRGFAPTSLIPWKQHLASARAVEPVEELALALEDLIAAIP